MKAWEERGRRGEETRLIYLGKRGHVVVLQSEAGSD